MFDLLIDVKSILKISNGLEASILADMHVDGILSSFVLKVLPPFRLLSNEISPVNCVHNKDISVVMNNYVLNQ